MIFSTITLPSEVSNLFDFFRTSEKVNSGGSATPDIASEDKKIVPSSQPINILRTNSAPATLKDRVRESEILEFSARSQFFCLFQHSMSHSRSAPSSLQGSAETKFLRPSSSPSSQTDVFSKYVICYMNQWEAVYDSHFNIIAPRREKQVIAHFQCFVHPKLTPLEWRICSSFLKDIKPEYFERLLTSEKEFREFRQIIVKHYLGQQNALKKLFNQDYQEQQNLNDDFMPPEIACATIFRYYLATYYPNFTELWYPSDIILDSPLILDISQFHLRFPFPNGKILNPWLNPQTAI